MRLQWYSRSMCFHSKCWRWESVCLIVLKETRHQSALKVFHLWLFALHNKIQWYFNATLLDFNTFGSNLQILAPYRDSKQVSWSRLLFESCVCLDDVYPRNSPQQVFYAFFLFACLMCKSSLNHNLKQVQLLYSIGDFIHTWLLHYKCPVHTYAILATDSGGVNAFWSWSLKKCVWSTIKRTLMIHARRWFIIIFSAGAEYGVIISIPSQGSDFFREVVQYKHIQEYF